MAVRVLGAIGRTPPPTETRARVSSNSVIFA
jgi:hypothetical protein